MSDVTKEDVFSMALKWKAYAEEGDRIIHEMTTVIKSMAEIETLREAAEAVYNDWAVGEPMDRGMKELGHEIDIP